MGKFHANPDYKWDWNGISANPNVTWDIIHTNPDHKWNWWGISSNTFGK
jgi:hypothetical protein